MVIPSGPIDIDIPPRSISIRRNRERLEAGVDVAEATVEAAVASSVLTKASAAMSPASSAEPALKPNQPTHSSEAPIMVMVIECGAIDSRP